MPALRAIPLTQPKAALYLRQSIARDESISLELQEIAGRDHCARQGYQVVAVEVDEGLSGRNWSKRPAVQRVLDSIESGEADVIVLWKWSRLSRNRKDWAVAADRVDVAGGRIESATEPIDTATASGRFARGVMTEYSAFQSEQIGEQWKEVFSRRASLGLPPTGSLPWGWAVASGSLTIDEESARVIRSMYQMYSEGSGLVRIAHWLNGRGLRTKRGNMWQHASVRSCMESPVHAGFIVYDGERHDGAHDGVIAPDDFERFLSLRADRSTPKRPRLSSYMLSTLVVCHCGRKRVGNVSGTQRDRPLRSYVCTATEKHPRKSRVCSAVDGAVSAWVKTLNAPLDTSSLVAKKSDVEAIARELTDLEKRTVRLTEHLLSGLVPEGAYKQTVSALSQERARLTGQLVKARAAATHSPAQYLSGKEGLIDGFDLLPVDRKQALLRSIIAQVKLLETDDIEVTTQWGNVVVLGSS